MGLAWDINITAVSLFWNSNIENATSCENNPIVLISNRSFWGCP